MKLLIIPITCIILFFPLLAAFSLVVDDSIAAGLAGIATYLFLPYWFLHCEKGKIVASLLITLLSILSFFPLMLLYHKFVPYYIAVSLAGTGAYLFIPYWLSLWLNPPSNPLNHLRIALDNEAWQITHVTVRRATCLQEANPLTVDIHHGLIVLEIDENDVIVLHTWSYDDWQYEHNTRDTLYFINDTNGEVLGYRFAGNAILPETGYIADTINPETLKECERYRTTYDTALQRLSQSH